MIDAIYDETKKRMGKTIEILKTDLMRIRTGRASLSLLDGIRVDYYGTQTPLNQVASLSIPDSRSIAIQPWDTSVIKEIEKEILKSDLGLTPANDGKIIRIAIPPLTEERRKDLVKIVKKTCEDHKIALRNIRRDSNEKLKEMKKDAQISEDDAYKAQGETQKITDEYIRKVDDIYKEKEQEILEF